jgi:translocator protein
MNRWIGLVVWIGLSLLAGVVGSQFQPGEWYATLAKPSWNPPSWVFAPVWTTLYALMGVAAWLVWDPHRGAAQTALTLFVLQLIANAAWSWLFFGLQSPFLAFIDIVVLWLLIIATTLAFRRLRPIAAALLLPYLAWVTFAAALNYQIWRLNS